MQKRKRKPEDSRLLISSFWKLRQENHEICHPSRRFQSNQSLDHTVYPNVGTMVPPRQAWNMEDCSSFIFYPRLRSMLYSLSTIDQILLELLQLLSEGYVHYEVMRSRIILSKNSCLFGVQCCYFILLSKESLAFFLALSPSSFCVNSSRAKT